MNRTTSCDDKRDNDPIEETARMLRVSTRRHSVSEYSTAFELKSSGIARKPNTDDA